MCGSSEYWHCSKSTFPQEGKKRAHLSGAGLVHISPVQALASVTGSLPLCYWFSFPFLSFTFAFLASGVFDLQVRRIPLCLFPSQKHLCHW